MSRLGQDYAGRFLSQSRLPSISKFSGPTPFGQTSTTSDDTGTSFHLLVVLYNGYVGLTVFESGTARQQAVNQVPSASSLDTADNFPVILDSFIIQSFDQVLASIDTRGDYGLQPDQCIHSESPSNSRDGTPWFIRCTTFTADCLSAVRRLLIGSRWPLRGSFPSPGLLDLIKPLATWAFIHPRGHHNFP